MTAAALMFSWKWEFIPLGRAGQGAAPACSVQVQAGRQEHTGDERLEDRDCICAVKMF